MHIERRGRIQKPKVHCLTSIHWAFDITTITRTSQVEIVVKLFGLLHILLGLTIPKSVPITPVNLILILVTIAGVSIVDSDIINR